MSLATLKKKAEAKYKNSSVNVNGFSLNGIHRNQGYVGQSSVGRSLSRALRNYDAPRGHGGCCGTYKTGSPLQSGIVQNDTSKNVKPSSVSQKEVINRRKGCYNSAGGKYDVDGTVLYNGSRCNVVKNDGPKHNNSAGDFIEYYRQKKIKEVNDCVTKTQFENQVVLRDIVHANNFAIIHDIKISDDGTKVAISSRENNAERTEFYTYSGSSYTMTAPHPGVGGIIGTSGDFSRFVVGDPWVNSATNNNVGNVYVYEDNDSLTTIIGSNKNDRYGIYVAMNSIGTRFAFQAGLPSAEGEVRIYDFSKLNSPKVIANPRNSGDYFGDQLSFNKLGTILAIGARNYDINGSNEGVIRVYQLNNQNNWVQLGQNIYGDANNDLLRAVQLSEDGLTMVAGATSGDDNTGNTIVNNTGTVKVYHYYTASQSWQQRGQTLYGTAAQIKAGKSVAISGDGNRIAFASELYDSDPNSATTEGIVYVYDFVSPDWVLFKTIIGEVDREIGQFISMTPDGTKLAVSTGSTLPLSVQVYELKTVEVAKNYPTCLEGVKPNCNVVKSETEIKSAISQSDYISRLKSKCPDQTKDGMYFSHAGGSGIVCAGAD